MNELHPKTQQKAFLLVILAIIVGIGGYYIVTAASADNHAVAQGSQRSVNMGVPGGLGGPGGMGGHGASCPTTQLSTLLGAQVATGHSQSASGAGAGVESVKSGSLAAKVGLKGGDVIVAVNGQAVNCPMTTLNALNSALANVKPGSKVTLTVDRDGASKKLFITSALLQPKPAKTKQAAKTCGMEGACSMKASHTGAKASSDSCSSKTGGSCSVHKKEVKKAAHSPK